MQRMESCANGAKALSMMYRSWNAPSTTNGANGTKGVEVINGSEVANGHSSVMNGAHPDTIGNRSLESRHRQEKPLLFPLTAHSDTALDAMAPSLVLWLTMKDRTHSELEALSSHTLACRRSAFAWRRAVIASNPEELKTQLARLPKAQSCCRSKSNVCLHRPRRAVVWHGALKLLRALSASGILSLPQTKSFRILVQSGASRRS